jgi:hypothetical protein
MSCDLQQSGQLSYYWLDELLMMHQILYSLGVLNGLFTSQQCLSVCLRPTAVGEESSLTTLVTQRLPCRQTSDNKVCLR